jgi:hypothetical protein
MIQKRPIKPKIYARAVTAITLIVVWLFSAFSGLVLTSCGTAKTAFWYHQRKLGRRTFLDMCSCFSSDSVTYSYRLESSKRSHSLSYQCAS